MSGLSLEALNDIGQRQTRMLIVLNDNEMSISPTVGALSKYLSTIKLSRPGAAAGPPTTADRAPAGRRPDRPRAVAAAAQVGRQLRPAPGQLFEDLGITYIGVVPGHDLQALERHVPAGARAARAGDRPRPDPEGPRLPAGRGATRSASTARRCRR